MARVYNFSAGPAVLPEEVLAEAASRDARLPRLGHVRHGDEPPLQAVRRDHRERRGRPARARGHSRQLPRAVPAGRRVAAVRRRAHEPHEEPRGRLYRHRRLGEEGLQGSQDLRRRPRHRQQRGRDVLLHPRLLRPGRIARCRLRVHLREQHHLRHEVPHAAEHQGQGPRGRRVVVLPVRAGGHHPLRRHVRRRTEEHRPGRRGHLHHPRGPYHGRRAGGHAHHAEVEYAGPTRTRSTTRRPPTASTSAARCSSG